MVNPVVTELFSSPMKLGEFKEQNPDEMILDFKQPSSLDSYIPRLDKKARSVSPAEKKVQEDPRVVKKFIPISPAPTPDGSLEKPVEEESDVSKVQRTLKEATLRFKRAWDQNEIDYNKSMNPTVQASNDVVRSYIGERITEAQVAVDKAYETGEPIPDSIWTSEGTVQQIKDQFQGEYDPHYAEIKRLEDNPAERDKLFTSEKPLQGIMAAIAIIMGSVGDAMTPGNQNTGVVISNLLNDAIEKEYKSKLNLIKDKKATELSKISTLLKHQDKVIQVARLKIQEAANRTNNYYKKQTLLQQAQELAERQAKNQMALINAVIINKIKIYEANWSKKKGEGELELQRYNIKKQKIAIEQNLLDKTVYGLGVFATAKAATEARDKISQYHKIKESWARLKYLYKNTSTVEMFQPWNKKRAEMKSIIGIMLTQYKGEAMANLGAAFTAVEDKKFVKDVMEKPGPLEYAFGVFGTKIKVFGDSIETTQNVLRKEAKPLIASDAVNLDPVRLKQYLLGGGPATDRTWAIFGRHFGLGRKELKSLKDQQSSEQTLISSGKLRSEQLITQ